MFSPFLRSFFVVPMLLAAVLSSPVRADYRDDIGYSELQALLGPQTPSGADVEMTQVEALESSAYYFPNTNSAEFSAKTIVDATGTATGTSSHATAVGRHFYGNQTSIAPGVDTVDSYSADDWLGGGFLKTGVTINGEPLTELRDVQNHSWIGTGAGSVADITRRLDYAIRRDGFTAVVGMNNGSSTTIPSLLGHSYNAISVGRSDGGHSHGFTSFEEPGRVKPDLVAPLSATSYSTPVVGAAAALLIEAVRNEPAWTGADSPECVKALLMAGATKKWASWDRTPARPLDEVYGAGEVNILNSYLILTNGPQPSGSGQLAASSGWDAAVLAGGQVKQYFFELPPGYVVPELSVILTWNRHIVDTSSQRFRFTPEPVMPDMDLVLAASTGFVPGMVIDLSTSAVDNVEHVVRADLPPGQYVLEITTDIETEYAIAWRGTTVLPVPCFTAFTVETGGVARLTAAGLAGQAYELSYAESPAESWHALSTNTPTATTFEVVDPTAGSAELRSYRLRALFPP